MDEKVKHRMIGAAVFFALAVIFIPMLFEESLKPEDQPALQQVKIPQQPKPFESQINSLDSNSNIRNQPSEQQPIAHAPTHGIQPIELPVAQGITEVVIPSGTQSTATEQTNPNQAPNHAWMVQVGSFGSEANAHGLANELKKIGFKAFVELIQGNHNASMYRVAIGPESGRQNAEAVRDKLQQQLGMKALIKAYVQ